MLPACAGRGLLPDLLQAHLRVSPLHAHVQLTCSCHPGVWRCTASGHQVHEAQFGRQYTLQGCCRCTCRFAEVRLMDKSKKPMALRNVLSRLLITTVRHR